eukprot:TRINITY_DN606_c0_g1_i1.p1 TRINITY_DN606_c0_g1~~TRINITY_DN606_c0_g1_i1.p1  ORF type:complete len:106 (-),score=26.28 TRINITY_DN606_c0_g1_i1:206-523(-)
MSTDWGAHGHNNQIDNDRQTVTERAKVAAFKGAVTGFAITAPTVLLLNRFNNKFRARLGVSGKAAFVVMATCGGCWLSGEKEVVKAQRELKHTMGEVNKQAPWAV